MANLEMVMRLRSKLPDVMLAETGCGHVPLQTAPMMDASTHMGDDIASAG